MRWEREQEKMQEKREATELAIDRWEYQKRVKYYVQQKKNV